MLKIEFYTECSVKWKTIIQNLCHEYYPKQNAHVYRNELYTTIHLRTLLQSSDLNINIFKQICRTEIINLKFQETLNL